MKASLLLATAMMVITFCAGALVAAPLYKAELIFPLESFHNHASCIVECPNGDLLACWYRGAGPEKGDDVAVWGAHMVKGAEAWNPRFIMADTPGYPDDNPCMFIDPQERLWLFWPTLLANQWESALMKYRISSDYQMPQGAPRWDWEDVLHVTPADFEKQMEDGIARYREQYPETVKLLGSRLDQLMAEMRTRAADKLSQRLGWMTRAHPTLLPSGRLIVPLYTDTFSVSIMAMTDDWGKTWITSQALAGGGNIQPSVVRKNDGTLVTMMRENGLQRRIRISESKDDGMTWGPVGSMDLPNPGSGLEVIRLANGHWALIYNDTERGRHSLAVSISDDEGKTWKWTRHLEKVEPEHGGYSYPSIIQASDGTLHATYSFSEGKQSIKHTHFNEEWVMEGDPQ
jgi:predicted neuraminidase